MNKLIPIVALAGIMLFSPNFAHASLIGDEVSFNVEASDLNGFDPPTAVVVDDPDNPEFSYSQCEDFRGGTTVDVGDSSVWFEWGTETFCIFDSSQVWLEDLDWVDKDGKIVGVTGAENCELSEVFEDVIITFEDHAIHFEFAEFAIQGGMIECHFDIETEHEEDPQPRPPVVGGGFLPIDSTALLLAGAQSSAVWIFTALAVIGSVAFGALYLTTKRN